MSRIDPGLSEWGGFISHLRNKVLHIFGLNLYSVVNVKNQAVFLQAQLEILKMDFQEKKVNKNSFIEECEVVWDKMKEVGECEVLCTPVKYCGELTS